jgi:hypothetical protein
MKSLPLKGLASDKVPREPARISSNLIRIGCCRETKYIGLETFLGVG